MSGARFGVVDVTLLCEYTVYVPRALYLAAYFAEEGDYDAETSNN